MRLMLEQPGTTFVTLGQGLSLRRDVLLAGYREEPERLQSRVPPFNPDFSIAAIETAFGQPIEPLVVYFRTGALCCSVGGQVHRANVRDGTDVAVKVRRRGVAAQVRSDLRLLRRLGNAMQLLVPAPGRQQPLALIEELGTQLLGEIDLAREARNMRRLRRAIEADPALTLPRIIEPYASPEVLLQQFSDGVPIATEFGTERGTVVARQSLDVYLHQLLGSRLHLPLDSRGLALRGGRAGPVLAASGGLVDAAAYDHAVGHGCADDGDLATGQTRCPAAPFRPWQPIHQRPVPTVAGRAGYHLQHEPFGQLLGQPVNRELF